MCEQSEADVWLYLVDARLSRAAALLRSARQFTQLAQRHGVSVDLEHRADIERQLEELIDAADAVDAAFMGEATSAAAKMIDAQH